MCRWHRWQQHERAACGSPLQAFTAVYDRCMALGMDAQAKGTEDMLRQRLKAELKGKKAATVVREDGIRTWVLPQRG